MRTLIHLSDLHFGRINPALLDPLRRAVHDAKPDLVAISGDFTQRARRSQFAAARAFMDMLEPPKLSVPGNHDVPYWNVARRFLQPLTRFREFISKELEPEYQDEEMIVLGVNTARALAHGGGRINTRQVDRIIRRLAGLPEALVRIIVTHHPFSSRGRGELPSFNLLRIERPEIALVKYVWDPAAGSFAALEWGHYRHSAEGWMPA